MEIEKPPGLAYGARGRLEPLHPIQVARFRVMSAQENGRLPKGSSAQRATRQAAIRHAHPDWTAEEVERELAREFARART
ncbi:MAG TPA: hypothetical protein VIS99_16980 [Terrimicrobiaceae bacterium]